MTLVEWPYPQGQMAAYRDCIDKYKEESNWIGFIDLDEYVIPKTTDTIGEFLRKFSKRPAVLIYWKFFGTSGFLERDPERLVTEDFVVSWPKYTNIGKCFFNTAYKFAAKSEKNCVLHHLFYTRIKRITIPPFNVFSKAVVFGRHIVSSETFPIQINHYYTKSLAEYQVKKNRGDVYFEQNSHTDASFEKHEVYCTDTDYSAYKYLLKLKLQMKK